jgi:hypothetical protein
MEQMSDRRVDRIGGIVLLLAILPAGAAFGSDAPPNVSLTPTPLPKVEIQTVGTAPRFLTDQEQQKAAALSSRTLPRGGAATFSDATSLAFPWRLSFAEDKGPGLTTFLPMPGFAERTILAKPFVPTPNTAVEKTGGPVR